MQGKSSMVGGNAFVEKSSRDQDGGKRQLDERVLLEHKNEKVLGVLGS